MKDKQEFLEAMDLQQDADGHWFVNGDVEGDVNGNVEGSVRGNVRGDVEGTVFGSVKGRKWQFAEENERLREDCKFLLSFAPKDAVPELDPTFYRTGTYGGDLQLQQRIDGIKAALEENNDER